MKAAILKAFGSPLAIETAPEPVLGTGEVIIDVAATRVLSYADEVFSGERKYLLELPVIPGPGGIGRVRAIGPDATHLSVGDWVFCDPTVRSRDDLISPDITLQAWSARDAGGLRLQRHFRHGSFAEQMMVPTENVKRIGKIEPADAGQWCALGHLAGALWRFPCRQSASGRNRPGQRRDRQFWKCGGRRRACDGRGLRRGAGPQGNSAR